MATPLIEIPENLRLESHNSNLTNERIHGLERVLDVWVIRMHQDPTQENILGCYAIICAWYAYLRSIQQNRKKEPDEKKFRTFFDRRMDNIEKEMKELKSYALFIHKRIESPEILAIQKDNKTKELNKKFWNTLEGRMIFLIDNIIDEVRLNFQSLHFYFRTSKGSSVQGIFGDLLNLKAKKGTLMNEEIPQVKDPFAEEEENNNGLEGKDESSNGQT